MPTAGSTPEGIKMTQNDAAALAFRLERLENMRKNLDAEIALTKEALKGEFQKAPKQAYDSRHRPRANATGIWSGFMTA
jgi:hypothetical protein